MITIGLPKGLFFFEHHQLWEEFFRNLGCQVIVSQDTNKEILDNGVKHCSSETCLPVKVFHGHVYSLMGKADFVFIPRYFSMDTNEYTCPKLCGLPDMALHNLKRKVKILEVTVHIDLYPEKTLESLNKISANLGIDPQKVVNAFKWACMTYEQSQKRRTIFDRSSIPKDRGTISLSILGHPYMMYDSYLSMKLIDKLKSRNISVYTPRDIDYETKRKNAYPFQGKIFWDIGFELLGSAFTFAENKNIDGMIYITPFACGVDAFVLEFIERRLKSHYNLPLLKLTMDEHSGEAGFDTRLGAFLDMVG